MMATLTKRRFLLLGLAAAFVLSACSGGGGSPTEPEPPTTESGSALVSGKVLSVSGGSGSASGASVAGLTVRVQGTTLSTVTAADGQFTLSSVPSGDRQLVFEGSSTSAALALQGIQPGEQIQLQLAIQGGQVSVTSMHRGSGTGGGTAGPVSLTLAMQPDTWNTNWVRSSGTVSALIRGQGFDRVDLGSVMLVGSNPATTPVASTRAERAGNHVRAFFRQAAAFGSLLDPRPGETHTVTVNLVADGKPVSLQAMVRIVGPGSDDDGDDDDDPVSLAVEVQPDTWNTNWTRSSGTVSALIRGEGFERIDLGSIMLIGTAPAAAPLAPTRAQREGNHVRAFFSQSQAIGSLDTPVRGETHVVTLRLTVDGQTLDLTATVRVVGPPG